MSCIRRFPPEPVEMPHPIMRQVFSTDGSRTFRRALHLIPVRHSALHEQLVDLARTVWRASWVVVDATGIGAGLASFLAASLGTRSGPHPAVRVERFVFSAASKSRLGWDFLGLIDTGRFKEYASDADEATERGQATALYEAQLRATTYEVLRGPGNVLRWSVPARDGHDDLVVSAALTAELERLDPRPRIAHGSG